MPGGIYPGDKHIRRSGSDYTQAFLRLLPQGQAWPRAPDSTLALTVDGLSQYWGYVDARAADLLERESDPRFTIELLPDWERAWGLPDPCFPEATTIGERQRMLVLYMTWMGGQSREYFRKLMEFVGYEILDFGEYAPFMCGISRVGDTRATRPVYNADGTPKMKPNGQQVLEAYGNYRWYIGPPEQRFVWTVQIGTASLTWFRASSGQAGVDPHLRIGIPKDLQCLLNRWKPAHTYVALDFTKLAFGGPMQGTP
jgi:uncharacterized protein YmfQ (DUF2313 family)